MADGILLLSWKNHHAAFRDILAKHRVKESFTDVTLMCEGKFYPVHKLVLSACSEHLEKILESTHCRHPVIVLHGIKCNELESLLCYMYAGEVNVPQSALSQLMQAAELLEIKGLAVPDTQSSDPRKTRDGDNQTSPPSKRRRHEERSTDHRRESPASSTPPSNVSSTHNLERQAPTKHSVKDDKYLEMHGDDHSVSQNQSALEAYSEQPRAVVLENNIKEEANDIYYTDELSVPEATLDYVDPSYEREDCTNSNNMDGNFPLTISSSLEQQPSLHPSQNIPPQLTSTDISCPSSEVREWQGESSEVGVEGNSYPLVSGHDASCVAQDHTAPLQKQHVVSRDVNGVKPGCGLENQGPKQHSCPYCSYTTTQSSALFTHVMTHTSNGLLSCKLCSYQCRNYGELRVHEQTHNVLKPHCCPHCQYRTAKKYNLQIHIRSHTGEKPFQCPYCPFRSTNRSDLRKHIFTHKK